VVELDMQITEGKVEAYRAKVKVSFKYEGEQWLCSGCKLCPPVECHLGMSIDNLPAIAAGHEPSTYAKPDLAQPRSGTSCGRSGRIAPSVLCCSRLLSLVSLTCRCTHIAHAAFQRIETTKLSPQ